MKNKEKDEVHIRELFKRGQANIEKEKDQIGTRRNKGDL